MGSCPGGELSGWELSAGELSSGELSGYGIWEVDVCLSVSCTILYAAMEIPT